MKYKQNVVYLCPKSNETTEFRIHLHVIEWFFKTIDIRHFGKPLSVNFYTRIKNLYFNTGYVWSRLLKFRYFATWDVLSQFLPSQAFDIRDAWQISYLYIYIKSFEHYVLWYNMTKIMQTAVHGKLHSDGECKGEGKRYWWNAFALTPLIVNDR